jgi:hypothetical protein
MEEFLRGLRESGEVVIDAEPPPALDADVERALRQHDVRYRAGLAPGAPELEVVAAYWGAEKLYRACQLLTLRDAPPALAHETLLQPFDGTRRPETDYAVDLTLAYLPSLLRLANRVAPNDPVLDAIRELAFAWPLSSVGIAGLGCPERLPFWENSCLRGLYVDRIIETRDVDRLEDPEVAAAVRTALGAHPELAPRIMEFLNAS